MTSKQLFDKLKAKRSRHEEIWELSAQYTLPHVYMSDEDRERGIEPEDLIIGDSIGAECLSNLGSQILKIAFPAQGTFFTVTAKKNAELLGGLSDSQRDTIYRKVEEASMLGLYKRGLHSQKTPMMQKMLALGDTIYSVPKVKKEKIQVYDNNDVVIKRTRNGVVSDVIVKEKTEYRFLSESAKMQLREKGRQFRHDSDEVCMYTHEYLNNDDKYSLTYSIDDVQLDMPENFVTSSGRKFQVSSLTTVRGSHYGTGIVTQYLSLIHKANVYADTATDTAVAGSLVNWAVHPNANVRPEEWANREQGEPFGVKPDDIKAITADVGTHLQITQIMYAEIVRTLSRVFLLPQAVQRDAERVTAQEIRMIASRLEETHAGLYATIAEGLQRTLADIGMSLINDEELTPYLDELEVNLVTAMEAMSKGLELDNMLASLGDTTILNSVPPQIAETLKLPEITSTIFNNRNVNADKYIKSQEEIEAEQERQAELQAKASGQDQAQAQEPQLSQTQVFQQNTGLLEDLRQPLI